MRLRKQNYNCRPNNELLQITLFLFARSLDIAPEKGKLAEWGKLSVTIRLLKW